MVVEYIRYTVSGKERRNELVQAYREAAHALDEAPECLAYELSICEEDEVSAILRIEWQSTDAHLQGFRKSAVFQQFFRAIGGFVKEITEMRHYQLSEVVKRKEGFSLHGAFASERTLHASPSYTGCAVTRIYGFTVLNPGKILFASSLETTEEMITSSP